MRILLGPYKVVCSSRAFLEARAEDFGVVLRIANENYMILASQSPPALARLTIASEEYRTIKTSDSIERVKEPGRVEVIYVLRDIVEDVALHRNYFQRWPPDLIWTK